MKPAVRMVFRCDAGPTMGWGHMMRCLALAEQLRAAGAEVLFAGWTESSGMARRVRTAGSGFLAVGKAQPRSSPLGREDLEATLAGAAALGAGGVLVDHYQADDAYCLGIADAGLRLAVIDDIADRRLEAADWLLNQNIRAETLSYPGPEPCCRLLGPRYALLRPQFAGARGRLRRRFGPADNRVLLTMGGANLVDRYTAVLERLVAVKLALEIRCVVGALDQAYALGESVPASHHRVTILTDVSDMAAQMALSDVSVNGGGSTCWELCCLGVAMVTVSLSDDQSDNVAELAARGVARGVGAWRKESAADIAVAVESLLANPTEREAMSARSMALVDGRGAERAAASLMEVMAAEWAGV